MRYTRLVFSLVLILSTAAVGAAPPAQSGQVRTYYIAADEVVWNYAPAGKNAMMNMPYIKVERAYAVRSKNEIGPKYWKAIYREYTDNTFKHLKPRAANQQYLGLLGPVIHAEVGDTIKVVFKNNASHPYSVHPHGVFYTKANEGSAYEDGSEGASKIAGAVPPGHTYTYTWQVPERAGPGPEDPSSVVWLYHSHAEDQRDVDAGLVGAMVVTRRGMARPDGTPNDVDREFVTDYQVFNENQSWYLDRNMRTFAPQLTAKDKIQIMPFDEDGGDASFTGHGFADGNFKFTINGYLYGEGPMMVARRGERVRWYVLSLGDGLNLHTPHWHGNTVLFQGHRTDVLNIGAAQMLEADMVPDNPGVWLFHCHYSDHMAAGMLAFYKVL